MTPHPEERLVERYESLSPVRRDELLRHAAACEGCRAALVRSDPSRLFALLAAEPVSTRDLDRLSAGVDRQLDRLAPRRRGARRWRRVASIAASLALAGLIGLPVVRHAPDPGIAQVDTTPLATALAAQQDRAPLAGVQLLSTPGNAQVMELSIGETQVVMIFDEALEL